MTVGAKPVPSAGTNNLLTFLRRRSVRSATTKWSAFVLLAAGSILFVAPVIWMFVSALKQNQLVFDGQWVPHPAVWSNFPDAWNAGPFWTYLKNTMIVTVFSVTGFVLSSSLVAYGFARLQFPGREFLFILVLATMLLPGIV